MADPIEIIQTVISVSREVCGAIKSIKDAPNELKTLDIEVSRLLPILEHLFAISGLDHERDGSALKSLCDEARELVEWAKGVLTKNEFESRRLPAKKWAKWLLERSNRQELVKRFEKMNSSVVTYLSYDGHRGLNRLQENVNGWMITLSSQLEIHQQSTMQHQRLLEDMNDAIRTVRQRIADEPCLQIKQHSAAVRQYNAGPQEVGSGFDRCNPLGIGNANICASNKCPVDCRCRCHGRLSSFVPRWLRPAVGNVFIHHYWLSVLASDRTTCNDGRCRRDRSNLLQIQYTCPTWFAQISIELQTQSIPLHFCIRTPRVVQYLGWLDKATLEEVRQKLRSRELTVNDVEPDGLSALHMVTWRLTVGRSEAALSIVALFIDHSAPTEWEYSRLTPAEDALWASLVHWRRYGSLKAAFDALQFRLGPYLRFDLEEEWEEVATKLRWTDLHRRVCALPSHSPSTDLSSLPQELASQVNTGDALGWTPLLHAMLASPAALVALLQAGANPRIDGAILAWAADVGADAEISMLVRAGAYINAPDSLGRTALHYAAFTNLRWSIYGLSVALELVRHAGHLLNWVVQDEAGNTPLDFAQRRVDDNPADEDSQRILELYRTRRLPDDAQYLPTTQVVDFEDQPAKDDETGLLLTSLIRAALRGDIDAIGDLIGQGAMVNERDQEGRTLLHLVALGRIPNGYRAALELLRHGGWAVDWDARASDGQTALEIADGRLDQGELSDVEREEVKKIRDLLAAERLPEGEEYLWPCMDPDFYPPPMPGSWNY